MSDSFQPGDTDNNLLRKILNSIPASGGVAPPEPPAEPIPPVLSPLLTDLVSYWTMDEASGTRNDSHAANHAAVVGAPGSVTGKISNAVDASAGNYLDAGSNASLQTGDIDFTLAAWVWLDGVATALDLLGKWGPGQLENFIYFPGGVTPFGFFVSPDGVNFFSVSASSFGAPTFNTWYFIVCWHDAIANTINIQVNDGAVDSTAHATGVFAGTAPFLFGASGFSSHDGRIDEVGFWKRVLTAPERTSLYNAGAGLAYPFS